MILPKKVFGRVQFYNQTSEYFESLEDLMNILLKQREEERLVEYMVIYGHMNDGKLYRSVFDFNSFSQEELAMEQLDLRNSKFQKYLGEILLEQGMITASQLKHALAEQQRSKVKERLGEVFARLGYIKNEDLLNVLVKQLGLKIDL